MITEKLIGQIKLHPILYDTVLPQYRDNEARNIAWEEIARNMKLNVSDVKTRWGKLRNSYSNAVKRRYRTNKGNPIQQMPWKYQKQMKFLLPHLKYKTKLTNINRSEPKQIKDELSSFNEYETQVDELVSPASSPKYVSPIEDDLESYSPIHSPNSRNMDHLHKEFFNDLDENDLFFLSMSKMLKRLPQTDQVDIKFELHKLIYEAEKRQLENECVY